MKNNSHQNPNRGDWLTSLESSFEALCQMHHQQTLTLQLAREFHRLQQMEMTLMRAMIDQLRKEEGPPD